MRSIADIKTTLKHKNIQEIPEYLTVLREDPRTGVQNLIQQYEKKYEGYQKEIERLEHMCQYEKKYYEKGYELIAGIDEVGRGPLAGPVVAAAVILPRDCRILGINDSKKLSEDKRKELFEEIRQKAIGIGVGVVDVGTIDAINILQATYEAMRKALDELEKKPAVLLVDAVHIPGVSIWQEGIIQGDGKSISIAAASIIAKVTRDEMMKELDQLYPVYQFGKNKGYGTADHVEAIRSHGLCPIHRRSFTSNFV